MWIFAGTGRKNYVTRLIERYPDMLNYKKTRRSLAKIFFSVGDYRDMKYMMLCGLLLFTTLVNSDEVLEQQEVPRVVIQTNLGVIEIELNPEKAPETVQNFLQYVHEDFYEGTIFHRVIPNFVIQTGGYTADYDKKPTYSSVPNEAKNGLKNVRGSVAMARSADPHSASSQFFINLNDNSFLNYTESSLSGWGYAVFGKVIDGMDVVDKIAKLPTEMIDGSLKYVPQTAVVIEAVTVDNVPATYWNESEADEEKTSKAAKETINDEELEETPEETTISEAIETAGETQKEEKTQAEENIEETELLTPEEEIDDEVELTAQPLETHQEDVAAKESTVAEAETTATEQQQDSDTEQEEETTEDTVEEQAKMPTEEAIVETESAEVSATLPTVTEVNEATELKSQSTSQEVHEPDDTIAPLEAAQARKKLLPDSSKFTVTEPPDPPSEPDVPEPNPF